MNKSDINSNQSLVVFDATEGFTTKGTFGKVFGLQDVIPIDETFGRLQKFINANVGVITARCLVKSVYPPGKFTNDQRSPLYNLCVEGSDDIRDAICIKGQWYTVRKTENDATTEKSFCDWIRHEIIEEEKRSIVVAGCTLTTCVSQTVLSMRRILDDANKERTDIIAPLDLIGCRQSYFEGMNGGKSRVDQIIEEMRDRRITVIDTLA